MDTFNAMMTFVKVVEAKSFAEAARQLRTPKSTLSRRISRLEEHLGVQLMIRTTRTLNLTDLGEAYYQRCKRIVQEVRETEELLAQMHTKPKGMLRVSLPVDGSRPIFANLVTQFLKRYPDIQMEALSSTRHVNLVEEGFDVAIRASRLPDSTLIARRIMKTKAYVVGSPGYFAEHGTPEKLSDLSHHSCATHGLQATHLKWQTKTGVNIPIQARLRSNSLEYLRQTVLEGLCLALIPKLFVQPDIDAGRLLPIFPDDIFVHTNVYVIYPGSRYISPKVRAFVDFCIEHFEKETSLQPSFNLP